MLCLLVPPTLLHQVNERPAEDRHSRYRDTIRQQLAVGPPSGPPLNHHITTNGDVVSVPGVPEGGRSAPELAASRGFAYPGNGNNNAGM